MEQRQTIWQKLTEPHSSIKDIAKYRNARLLSIFSLVMLVVFAANMTLNFVYLDGYRLSITDAIGYGVLLLIYIISRTKYYQTGIILLLAMFPLNSFGNLIQGTVINANNTISYIVITYIISIIFLSPIEMGIFNALVIFGIALLPYYASQSVPSFSFLISPLIINILGAILSIAAKVHLNLVEQARQNELKVTYDNTLKGWAKALETRDMEISGHSDRVTKLTRILSEKVGITNKEELEHIHRGALLHDIGKMAISDNILTKKGTLSQEEWGEIHKHPEYARDMVQDIPFLFPSLDIPYCHHEKWDGTGYPRGLVGDQIPIAARIFAVVDVWDALRSDRPYRKKWEKEKALQYIEEMSGTHFDPDIVAQFLKLIEEKESDPE